MIDSFNAKAKSKKLIVKTDGITTLIAEPQGEGKKPKLIDIAMGDSRAIIQDLRASGYSVSILN